MTRKIMLPLTGLALALSTVSVAAMEESARGESPEPTIEAHEAMTDTSTEVIDADPTAPRAERQATTHAGPTHQAVDAAIAGGVLPMALSREGEVLGQIDSVMLDDAGVAQYSVQLDPSLQLEMPSVTYRGDASVDGDGQVTLEISRNDFVGAIMEHIQTN